MPLPAVNFPRGLIPSPFLSSHCIQQILEAVLHCHQMGVVHRDLKVSDPGEAAFTGPQPLYSLPAPQSRTGATQISSIWGRRRGLSNSAEALCICIPRIPFASPGGGWLCFPADKTDLQLRKEGLPGGLVCARKARQFRLRLPCGLEQK